MDKSYKQKKAARVKAEEAAINRILCWIVGGTAVEFVAMLLDRYWVNFGGSEIDLRLALVLPVKIVAVAGLLGAVGLGYWCYRTWQAGKDVNLSATLTLVALGISACCFGAWISGSSGSALTLVRIGVLMVVVLAVLFYLYQREFFLIACQSALAILGIWMCDRGMTSVKVILCILCVCLAVVLELASAFVCRRLQREDGVFHWKGKTLRVFPKDANYVPLYVGAGVTAAVLVCAVGAFVPAMALYAVAAAWVLVMAVYYTVKLM